MKKVILKSGSRHEREKADAELFHRFRSYIIENTQLNGSLYKRFPSSLASTGMSDGCRATKNAAKLIVDSLLIWCQNSASGSVDD